MNIPNTSRPQNGDEARDMVSGFTGIVTSVTEFLNGCRRVCLCPPVKADNTFGDERWFDDGQVEVTARGKVKPNPALPEPALEAPSQARKGGDRPDCPRG